MYLWVLPILAILLWLGVWLQSMLKRHGEGSILQPEVELGEFAGVKSIQGGRPHMEDTYMALINLRGNPKQAFFGVFDGHGGSRTSQFSAANLHKLILHQDFVCEPEATLCTAFKQLDQEWLQYANRHEYDDGSTAIAALLVNGTLYIANVGDSRAVLIANGRAVELSEDHKPNRADERMRIEGLGGRIIHYGTWRVEGILAVTRAVGDRRLKKFITAEPEVRSHVLREGDDFLILASDGVWDVMTSQQAVDIVWNNLSGSMQEAAHKLTDTAYRRGSLDNITSLVVDLRPYR